MTMVQCSYTTNDRVKKGQIFGQKSPGILQASLQRELGSLKVLWDPMGGYNLSKTQIAHPGAVFLNNWEQQKESFFQRKILVILIFVTKRREKIWGPSDYFLRFAPRLSQSR